MFKPNYTITDKLLNVIAEIEIIRTQVQSNVILPAREIEMRHRASIEATHSSTSIEGNPLSNKRVEKVLSDTNGKQLTRHQYAEIEVKNYKKALDWAERRKVKKDMLTVKDILTIHKIITGGLLVKKKSRIWRFNPVDIEDKDGNTLYAAVHEDQVAHEVENLVEWLSRNESNVHPVIAAGILHIQFVSIHPFADGNGRTARALTMLYLGLRGYDFRGSLVLDTYYSQDKHEYHEALHRSQGTTYETALTGNLNPWLGYFAEGFLSSAKVLAATVTILASAATDISKVERVGRDETDLLSYTQQFGSISLSEAESILIGVHKRTVQRKLKRLVDNGYLQMTGDARNTRYVLKQAH